MPETLLELRNVSMSYGPNLILRDISVSVEKLTDRPCGKVICFLGPSGMGKTQLSRIVAGLQVPSSGEVLLKGSPTGPGKACFVPQDYPLFNYTTVAGNLEIAGKQGGFTQAEINFKATELIESFNIKEHLNKFPRELSGGSRQRVAIARQLMCPSNYIVMDEPFSGLDPISKGKAMDAITKVADLSPYNVIIVVTHDVTSGLTIADTVWMLGYEKDANGVNLPGARIVRNHDLGALGFAWRQDLDSSPEFLAFSRQVKDEFRTLR